MENRWDDELVRRPRRCFSGLTGYMENCKISIRQLWEHSHRVSRVVDTVHHYLPYSWWCNVKAGEPSSNLMCAATRANCRPW